MTVDLANWLAAFDPGETTGYALFNAAGVNLERSQVKGRLALYDLLEEIGPVEHVIIEDFRLFQHKALQQSGSRLETVRVIGAIESWAHNTKGRVTLQPPTIKPIAQLWSGKVPKGSHSLSHSVDAFNHGFYFLQKNGYTKPKRQG
jgi:hypothetical protein